MFLFVTLTVSGMENGMKNHQHKMRRKKKTKQKFAQFVVYAQIIIHWPLSSLFFTNWAFAIVQ